MTAHAYDGMVSAQRIREACPDALICAGGIHFSAVPDESLRICSALDLVVVGEGERTLLELCQAVADAGGVPADWRDAFRDICGLAWLDGAGPGVLDGGHPNPDRPLFHTPPRALIKDLGWLAPPAYDLVQPGRYSMKPFPWGDYMMMEASRGCPFACTFCHTTQFWNKRWRPRPVEAVLDDVEYVSRAMGRPAIHFADDSWSTNRSRVIEFCEGVLSRGLNLDLWAQCRVDDLYRDRDLFPLMKRAGFYGMLIGFESGEQGALDRWDKGVGADKARELAPALQAHFDSIIGTFFIGDWESNEQTFAATSAFADELSVDIFIEAPLNLFPPTIPMWKEYAERGIDMEIDYDQIGNCKVILPTSTLGVERVLSLQKRNMLRFYGNPVKAHHALTSGPHAARQFSTMLLTVAADAAAHHARGLKDAMRDSMPSGWIGRDTLARLEFKERHAALAATRGPGGYGSSPTIATEATAR
jgi:radical SAM superfamily enzyme YgiQ (UPF0313 family)